MTEKLKELEARIMGATHKDTRDLNKFYKRTFETYYTTWNPETKQFSPWRYYNSNPPEWTILL